GAQSVSKAIVTSGAGVPRRNTWPLNPVRGARLVAAATAAAMTGDRGGSANLGAGGGEPFWRSSHQSRSNKPAAAPVNRATILSLLVAIVPARPVVLTETPA